MLLKADKDKQKDIIKFGLGGSGGVMDNVVGNGNCAPGSNPGRCT